MSERLTRRCRQIIDEINERVNFSSSESVANLALRQGSASRPQTRHLSPIRCLHASIGKSARRRRKPENARPYCRIGESFSRQSRKRQCRGNSRGDLHCIASSRSGKRHWQGNRKAGTNCALHPDHPQRCQYEAAASLRARHRRRGRSGLCQGRQGLDAGVTGLSRFFEVLS